MLCRFPIYRRGWLASRPPFPRRYRFDSAKRLGDSRVLTMDIDRSDIAATVLPTPAKAGGKRWLLTLDDLDGRTNASKRAHQLIAALTGDDPDITIEQKLRIVDLAVLNAMT